MKPLAQIFCEFGGLLSGLNTTLSTTSKREILGKAVINNGDSLKTILHWTLNPFKKFYVTSHSMKKYLADGNRLYVQHIFEDSLESLVGLLEELSTRRLSGHASLEKCWQFIEVFGCEDLFLRILDKDLKCRMGVKDVNKVIPGLIPEFSIALAEPHWKIKNLGEILNLHKFMYSRKLDGLRLIAICDNGEVSFYSRSGKEYTTLDKYKPVVAQFVANSDVDESVGAIILDGELVNFSDGESDDFKATVKQARKKDHQITDSTYVVFDILTEEEFYSGTSSTTLTQRWQRFPYNFSSSKLRILEQSPLDYSLLPELSKTMEHLGWEGLMFRRDTTYNGRRSKDIIKYKLFFDEEFKVLGTTNEYMQMCIDGQNLVVNALSTIIIDYKGNRVDPGSGFTQEERIEWGKNPELIIGKMATIQYKGETTDKSGKPSLQFPVFKGIRDNGE